LEYALTDEWLSKLGKGQCVLDLGSGSGSFDYSNRLFTIIAVDTDFHSISRINTAGSNVSAINAESHRLPFKNRSFSLVICNHTMEHFPNPHHTLLEVGRVLTPDGMLIITIPDGYGFDDSLYRFVMKGGGHVNRFSFDKIVDLVEEAASIRLVRWHELYSSYVYIKKPSPAVLPHLPRRLRWLSRLPVWAFVAMQFTLNIFCRYVARIADPRIALYGWALYFRRDNESLIHAPGWINVCRCCGAGHRATSLAKMRLARFLYRCPSCKAINPYFKPRGSAA
jgi:SAM-dependent methyltransferase